MDSYAFDFYLSKLREHRSRLNLLRVASVIFLLLTIFAAVRAERAVPDQFDAIHASDLKSTPAIAAAIEKLALQAKFLQTKEDVKKIQRNGMPPEWLEKLTHDSTFLVFFVTFLLAAGVLVYQTEHTVRPDFGFSRELEQLFASWKDGLTPEQEKDPDNGWMLHRPWSSLVNAVAQDPDFVKMRQFWNSSANPSYDRDSPFEDWRWLKEDGAFKNVVRLITEDELLKNRRISRLFRAIKKKAAAIKPGEEGLKHLEPAGLVPWLLLATLFSGATAYVVAKPTTAPGSEKHDSNNDGDERKEFREAVLAGLEGIKEAVKAIEEAKPQPPVTANFNNQQQLPPPGGGGTDVSGGISVKCCVAATYPACCASTHQDFVFPSKIDIEVHSPAPTAPGEVPREKVVPPPAIPPPATSPPASLARGEALAYFTKVEEKRQVTLQSKEEYVTWTLSLEPTAGSWPPKPIIVRAEVSAFRLNNSLQPRDHEVAVGTEPIYDAVLDADVYVESKSKRVLWHGHNLLVIHIKPRAAR